MWMVHVKANTPQWVIWAHDNYNAHKPSVCQTPLSGIAYKWRMRPLERSSLHLLLLTGILLLALPARSRQSDTNQAVISTAMLCSMASRSASIARSCSLVR